MECIKDEVIKMISKMPDDVSIDDIMEELYFKLQVNRGLQDLEDGKGISHEEVEKKVQQWLSK
jgi:predicted transcriptional regulator